MNQLSKITPEPSKSKVAATYILNFIFTNAIGISGLIMLICFAITGSLVYLKIASILSFVVIGLIFIMSSQALYLFGLEKCYVEIEAKFLDLTLYSGLVSANLLFLIIEVIRSTVSFIEI